MMSKVVVPFVRSAYNYDREAVSVETGLLCQDDTLAQQNFRDECDINTIVSTFTRTGDLPEAPLPPQFGDFSDVSDFHSALNQVLAAQEAFLALSPDVRSRFGNDPQQLMNFIADEKNFDEAVTLGLISKDNARTRASARTPMPDGAAAPKAAGGDAPAKEKGV